MGEPEPTLQEQLEEMVRIKNELLDEIMKKIFGEHPDPKTLCTAVKILSACIVFVLILDGLGIL